MSAKDTTPEEYRLGVVKSASDTIGLVPRWSFVCMRLTLMSGLLLTLLLTLNPFAVSPAAATSLDAVSSADFPSILTTDVSSREQHATPDLVGAAGTPATPPGLLFIGLSGLTPELLEIQENGLAEQLQGFAFAALSTRSFDTYTCPVEGWLQLRATGDVYDRAGRESAARRGVKCQSYSPESLTNTSTELPGKAVFSGSTAVLQQNLFPAESLFSPAVWAVGELAGIPVMNTAGEVAQWLPLPRLTTDTNTVETQFRSLLSAAPSDVIIDLGRVTNTKTADLEQSDPPAEDPDAELGEILPLETERLELSESGTPKSEVPGAVLDSPAVSAETLQRALAAVLRANAATAQPRPVLIASLADTRPRRTLQFFATNQPHFTPQHPTDTGVIKTSTTRAEGLATMADVRGQIVVAQQLLHRLAPATQIAFPEGIVIPKFSYQESSSLEQTLSVIQAQQRHADAAVAANSTWYSLFHALVWTAAAAFVLAMVFPSRFRRFSALPLSQLAALTFAFIPAALLLNWIPWWNFPWTDSDLGATSTAVGATVILAAVLAFLAKRTGYTIPALAAAAFVILSVDIIAGSWHQRNGFMGSLVLSSRRYYGISNRTYLILVIAGLLLLLPILQRFWASRTAVLAIVLIAVITLAVDALPGWGADFGGPPGIVAAFLTVGILAAGRRLQWWHTAIWVTLTLAFMGLIAWLSTFGPWKSHIGAFWTNLGTGQNTNLLAGKLRDVLRSFTGHPEIIALLAAVLALAGALWWMSRRYRDTWLRYLEPLSEPNNNLPLVAVFLGILLGVGIAVPVNDSGALMLKEAFYMAVPALVALASRRLYSNASRGAAYEEAAVEPK